MPASQSSHGALTRPGAAGQLAAVALLLVLTLAAPPPAAAVRSLSDWVGDAMITHFGGAQDGEEEECAKHRGGRVGGGKAAPPGASTVGWRRRAQPWECTQEANPLQG